MFNNLYYYLHYTSTIKLFVSESHSDDKVSFVFLNTTKVDTSERTNTSERRKDGSVEATSQR